MNAKLILAVCAVLVSILAQVARAAPEEGQEQTPRANGTRVVVSAEGIAAGAGHDAAQAAAG